MSIEAMKQALEALEANRLLVNGDDKKGGLVWCMDGYYSGCFDIEAANKQTNVAITALRQAIDQAKKQEPVAWIYTGIKQDGSTHGPHLVWKLEHMDAMSADKGAKANAIPLYTTPPAAPVQEPMKLWLWKNFVNGKPEYWAFDNPFPCVSVDGDPLTLGEPCGWALLKPSVNGRPDRSEQEVISTVTRPATPPAAQRQWVGLTDDEVFDLADENLYNGGKNYGILSFYKAIEAKLWEKNT
jgi:hypothetical protein